MLLAAATVVAQPPIDTLHFARPLAVEGGIPGLYRWGHSAQSDTAVVTILAPTDGQRYRAGDSIFVTVSVAGIAIGAPTQHADRCGLTLSPQGQHTHIILDDRPPLSHHGLGKPVFAGVATPGVHHLRVYACRSWHESIKSPGSFRMVTIHVDDTLAPAPGPVLTLNWPQGEFEGQEGRAILLDFLVSGCAIGPEDHRVRLTVDSAPTILHDLVPYVLTDLSPGAHHLRVELMTPDGATAVGRFTVTERTIVIK